MRINIRMMLTTGITKASTLQPDHPSARHLKTPNIIMAMLAEALTIANASGTSSLMPG
jgi:hypothetical protein